MENLEPNVIPEAQKVEGPTFAETIKLTGDTMKDLAAIAKEQGISGVTDIRGDGKIVSQATAQPVPSQPQAVEQPAQTVQQPAQTQVPENVPDKFKGPDGQVDVSKVEKAEKNIDAMIARYKAKEREASQLGNRVNNPAPAVPQQVQVPQTQHQSMLTPLEIQMAQDLMAEAAAYGGKLDQGQAIAMARVQSRALAARYQADLEATETLRRRVEDAERTRELQSLIDGDPELASEGMVDKLWQTRQDNPWLNNSPEPWKAAYIHYRGSNPQGRGNQVSTPTPKGQTVPPVPVSPVSRVQPTVDVKNPQALSNEQLIAEIKKIHPGFRG